FILQMEIAHQMYIWFAGLSLLLGVIDDLSPLNMNLIIVYHIIPAIAFIMMGIGVSNQDAISESIYYLIHDMIIKTALFLIVGAVAYVAGTSDLRKMGGLIHHYPVLGWLLFLSAFVLAGIPPFSGFIGKVLLLKGALTNDEVVIV